MFTEKTQEELNNLNSEELHSYYMAKLSHEKEQIDARVKSLEAEKNGEKYETLSSELKELKDTQFNTLKAALKEQGVVLEKLRNKEISAGQVNFVEGSIEKALNDHSEDFDQAKESKHGFKFNLNIGAGFVNKAAGDMTLAGNVTGGIMPQAQRLEGVNDIAERAVVTYPLIPKLNTDRNAIEWVYEANQDGTINGTAEGTQKDQIDNDFVVEQVSLVKRAAYFKVSTEMLDDVTFMAGWLRNKLIVRLFLDVDNQVLNGNNAAPNLNGVINQATPWAAGVFAGTVDNANDVDSLVVGKTQIKTANQGSNNLVIMMHPEDVAGLLLEKLSATDKRYVDRLIMVGSTLTLDGTPIIENNNIASGNFLIADFSKATIAQKSGIMVEVGLDGNDFTNNMRTIIAEWRGQCFIQNNDRTAFVYGTFATTNAALETP